MAGASLSIVLVDIDFAFAGANGSPVFEQLNATIGVELGQPSILGGRNGVGKSVLARLIAGLYAPTGGAPPALTRSGQPIDRALVVYVPQNLERGHDRFAADLFASIAGTGRRRLPGGLRRALRAAGVERRDDRTVCDKIDKIKLLAGVFAAASLSKAELLILDEPLAQIGTSDRALVDAMISDFATATDIPLLIIAHPSQSPSIGRHFELHTRGDDSKEIRPRSRLAPTPARPVPRWQEEAYLLSIEGPSPGRFEICRGCVNVLASPNGLPVGRMGSMVVGAFRARGICCSDKWQFNIQMVGHPATAPWPTFVKYLPPDAQASIVPAEMQVAEATLYDRWEAAPRKVIGRTIDRPRLIRGMLEEGRHFFPVKPSNADFRGKQLSGGNRQMLALRTIAYPLPELLVVSLAYSGLDEANMERVDHFLDYAAESGTIVISIEPAG